MATLMGVRRGASTRALFAVVACLLALAVVQSGPLSPAAQASTVTVPPQGAVIARAAPIAAMNPLTAVVTGFGVAAVLCWQIESCNNAVYAPVIKWLDDSLFGGQQQGGQTPGAPSGDTLSWSSTPTESAVVKEHADSTNPKWSFNWNPVATGSPGADIRADVTCIKDGQQYQSLNYEPVAFIYPGNPSGGFHANEVCPIGASVIEVIAWISSAEFCSVCGGRVEWRAASVDAPGAQRTGQVDVTCRSAAGAVTTIKGVPFTYSKGTSTNVPSPSCQGVSFPAVIEVEDTFTRADNATNPGSTEKRGLPWLEHVGNCEIATGRLRVTGTESICAINAGSADGAVEWDVPAMTGVGQVWFRGNSTGAGGYIWQSQGRLYSKANGSIPTSYTSIAGFVAGDKLRVDMAGSSLTFFVNGVQVKQLTDSVHGAGTHFGVRGSDTNRAAIDNLRAPGNLTVPAQTGDGLIVEVVYKCGLTIGTLEECAKESVNIPKVQTDFPDCATPGVCELDVWVNAVKCTPGTSACIDWDTKADTAPAGTYTCRWGPYTLPGLADCAGIKHKYEVAPAAEPTTQPTTSTSAQPDPTVTSTTQPTLSAAPQPTTSPSPTDAASVAPRPGEAGAPAVGDAEGNECWPSGWGVFNPLEWVYRPTVCALKWAFVPRADVWAKTMGNGGLLGTWKASPFGAWSTSLDATVDSFAGIDDQAAGCGGPTLSGSIQGANYELRPLRACEAPMSTVASVTKALLTVIVGVGGAFLITEPIFGALGLSIRPRAEAGELA